MPPAAISTMPARMRGIRQGRAANAAITGRNSASNHGLPRKPCISADALHHEPSTEYHGSSASPAAVAAIQTTWVVL
jgi:hypothetical protein